MKRDWTEAWLKVRSEGHCRVCGSVFQLDPAHVIDRSIGGKQEADSIVPLCRSCHDAYDGSGPNGQTLDLLPHLTKDEQAEAVRVLGLTRALARLCPSENHRRVEGQGRRAA